MNKSFNIGRFCHMALMLCVMLLVSSCEKEYKLELPLAVTQESLDLGAGGGSTHVLVYCTGNWTASLKNIDDESWASIDKASGKENGEFIFNYADNPGVQRMAVVVITSGERTQEIKMKQSGFLTTAELVPAKSAVTIPSWKSDLSIGFETNMGLALERIKSGVEYSTDGENFTAATNEDPGWITDIVVSEDLITFKTAANETGTTRMARLIVSVYDNVKGKSYKATTLVTQEAQGGYFRFENAETPTVVESFAKDVVFPWTTNMEMFFDAVKFEVAYTEPGEEWITNITPETDGLHASILESRYAGERHAAIKMSYNGPEGSVTATCNVTQDKPALEVPYADLRARLTAAGTVTLESDFIMAQVISEPGNPNMETNPQPDWYHVDLTESQKTAYIQSLDGKYGFRVKAVSADDLKGLARYSIVKIALSDLVLEREDNPVRYTIRNFTSANILESEPAVATSLASKERYINQLTDDDIYTFVTFPEMELAFRYGAWGNQHEGFAEASSVLPSGIGNKNGQTRSDCMPRFFLDSKGGIIPMIINAQVPWRRFGKEVPKGSGTVKGIIVHSPLGRFNKNGEMGTYQFRVVDAADISLGSTSTFSNIIAEWEWNAKKITLEAGSDRIVLPNTGSGKMSTSAKLEGTKTALTTSFIQPAFSATGDARAFRYNAKWWNFTKDEGEDISWTFSTAGLTGHNLTISMTAGSGNQAAPCPVPARWNLEYSTDGVNFTVLEKNFYLYPAPIFAYTKMDSPSNNAEMVFRLPDELFGHESVTVRIKANTKKCCTTSGLTSGTITGSDVAKYVRFEAIAIRYNK